MRTFRFLVAVVIAAAATSAVASATSSSMPMMSAAKTTLYTPATIHWVAGTGNMKGLMVAMLEGNPGAPGPWTIRLKLPAGTKFPAHYHTDTERVTVISGTMYFGVGRKFDAAKLMYVPPGSYAVIPAGVRHFLETKTETVIQLSGSGPFGMKMDNGPGM